MRAGWINAEGPGAASKEMTSHADLDATVLLTTRNRAALLRSTLNAFQRMRTSGVTWEIVVVDNGSSDETDDVLEQAASQLPLRVVREPSPGKSAALNRALPLIRARLVLLTDDDVRPCSEWMTAYVAAARRWPQHRVFGGPIKPLFPNGTPDWLMNHPCTVPAFARFTLDAPEGPMSLLPFGPNVAFRADALRDVVLSPHVGPRGTSYPMGTDIELIRRVLMNDEQVVYVPAAATGHVVRPEQITHKWLMQRAYNLGRSAPRYQQSFPAHAQPPVSRGGARRRILVAALRYFGVLPHGPKRRLERGAMWHYWRGYRYEQRRMAAELGGQ